jgi:hypothetical protein
MKKRQVELGCPCNKNKKNVYKEESFGQLDAFSKNSLEMITENFGVI